MSDIGFGPVGDPPIIYDTFTTDGYGRVTRLVDRRLLEQAQARIAKLERELRPNSPLRQQADTYQRILRHPEIYRHMRECNKSRSDQIMARIDDLAAERDHWRAEVEKACTPARRLRAAANVLAEYQQHHGAGCANADDLHAEADRLESEATADGLLPTVEESHQLDNATLDRLAGHFGVEVPATARRPEATADDVVEKVARVLAEAAHDDWDFIVQRGQDREAAVTRAIRDRYLDTARAVAGLLRGDR